MATYYSQYVQQLYSRLYPRQQVLEQLAMARKYMESHYAEPINVKKIAGSAFYSRFHFIRMFRQVYGRTPVSYLTSIRMQQAAAMLQSGRTVKDACYGTGYSSIHTFTILFRRSKGMTPAAWRKKHLYK